jgi:Fungal protein of unknown function (DUF1752)
MTSHLPHSLDEAPELRNMEDLSWEDILRSKAHKHNKEPSRAFQNLSLSSLVDEQNTTSDIDSCDTDSQWSENGSLMSTCFSSTSTSGTRSTRISLSSRASCPDEDDSGEDRILFPSYDDVGYYGQHGDSKSPVSNAFPENETPSIVSEDPLSPIERPDDDTAIRIVPTRHVDYLSHDWTEQDLCASWRLVTSKKKSYSNSARLVNASWRAWGKIRLNLETVSPERLNW